MENGDKQQVISFSKGMSNVPNDVLCGDDTCSEVVGLTSENGEMRPIQKPTATAEQPPMQGDELLYVHQTQTGKVYIYMYYQSPGNVPYLKCHYNGDSHPIGDATSSDVNITSIGNTLIASSAEKGIQYLLWDGTTYKSLGSKIPEPDVKFWIGGNQDVYGDTPLTGLDTNALTITDREAWNNLVIGDYSRLVNELHKDKAFFAPFFALAALELYDGSYYMATSPVLLYPNFQSRYCGWLKIVATLEGNKWYLESVLSGSYLRFKHFSDYSDWSDIVKNVTIFVTEEARLFNTDSDAIFSYFGTRNDNTIHTTTRWKDEVGQLDQWNQTYSQSSNVNIYELLETRLDGDVIKDLAEKQIFYRLCDIGQTPTTSSANSYNYFDSHVLENLTTQTRLDVDGGEYFDHTIKFGESVYSLNGRLHMANIRRSFFDGFKQFISKDNETTHKVDVAIKTPQGIKIVTQEDAFGSVGHYFYYPDPRAEYVRIDGDGNNPIVKKLEEHKGLNGVYCIVSPLDTLTSDTDVTFPTETFVGSYELLPNKVLVSEVDNPFVIRAAGYNTVGNGEVMAIVSNTTALSEGQHGQHPLYAFSTDGIWGLKTNEKGTYSAVDPVSRDICNNAKSVTQTDSAVFFTSEKGLMMIVGAQARCVSEQMNGRTEDWGFTLGSYDSELQALVPVHFKEFLRGCNIAYDYRDSLLWILNENYEWHYVYNIKSGTFALMDDDVTFARVVSDYPDNLLQDTEGQVYTLLNRPDQNEDVQMYEAYITTRPMKFGNALTLKSMREIKHLKDLREGEMHVTLWASNDGKQWVRLNSLRGKAWRYFRLRYAFIGMAATDRFIGTVFVTQERRQWRLR